MSGGPRTLEIALFANGKFLGSRSFTSSPITIGRGPKSTLRLNDPAVSTDHAVITLTARSCVIEDVGSSNGTFVAGQRIESHVIRPSHEVAIGPFSLRFVLRSDDSPDVSSDPAESTSVTLGAPGHRIPLRTAPMAVIRGAQTPTAASAPAAPAPPAAVASAAVASAPAPAAPAAAALAAPALAPAALAATASAAAGSAGDSWSEAPTRVAPPSLEDLAWLEELDEPTIRRRRPAALQAPAVPSPGEPRRSTPAALLERSSRHSDAPSAPLKVTPPEAARARRAAAESLDDLERTAVDLVQTTPAEPVPAEPAVFAGAAPVVLRASAPPSAVVPHASAPPPAFVPQRSAPPSAVVPQASAPPSAFVPQRSAPPSAFVPQRSAPPSAFVPQPSAPSAFVPDLLAALAAEAAPPALAGRAPLAKAPPVASAPPAPPAHLDDDDDEDDSGFVPAFSLVQHLLEGHRDPAQAPGAVAELIVHRDDRVIDVIHLARGRKVRFPGTDIVAAAHRRAGKLVITVRGQAAGQLFTATGARDLAEVAKRSSRRSILSLSPEHVASLDAGRLGTLHAHFVPAPRTLSRQRVTLFPSRAGMISSATSFVVHVAVFVWLAFFQSEREVDALPTEGRFAKVDIKDLELTPPPPPPPPPLEEQKVEDTKTPDPEPPPLKPEPTPPKAKPKAKPTRAPRATASAAPTAGTPTGPPAPSKQAASLLSAINVADASPSATATSVTNLDAVKVARGTSAGFKTADTVGKLPGDRLALPGGVSDGRIDTKSGTEVTKGNVGKVNAVEGKDGPVRGTVARAPAREVDVEGELDRSLVLKVVNEHMREVQSCYERKLVQDRNLSGKIVFEWVITTSGNVSVVRVKFSSMRNVDVTTCIQSAIRSWSFPKPTGGNATIVYPFVFSTLGG